MFDRVVEDSLDAIVLIDPASGAITRANRAVERCLGYAPSRIVGRHFSVLFPSEVWAGAEELVAAVRQHGGGFGVQSFQRANGTVCAMELRAALLPWGDDLMLMATLRDVSELQRAEEALRRSEERLQLVLRGADLGLWDWDVISGQAGFNARACEIVGYAAEELEPHARTWDALVHPADRVRVAALMQAHLRGETPLYESEHRLRHRDGHWVWVLHRGKVVSRDPEGRPLRATGTQFDISDRKRNDEERQALLEMAKDLSGTLDLHELVASVQRRTAELLPADVAATIYWDPDFESYRMISQHGLDAELATVAERISFPLGGMFGGRVMAGETLVVDDPDAWGERERAVFERFRIRALASVPLIIRGQVRGAFCVANRPARPFTANQIRFLEAIAGQLTVAVETAALYRAQQAETEFSAALARVGQELIAWLATPALTEALCRSTAAVLGCDVSATLLWQPREQAYVPVAMHGDSPERWEALRVLRFTPSMVAAVLAGLAPTGLVRLSELAADDPVRLGLGDACELESAIFVALRRGDEMSGILCAGFRRPRSRFSAHQERIARGIAQIASMALENARLLDELERANRIKSDFVATMSHELRTPLNVVIGYHDLLLEGEFGPLSDEQQDRLRRADHSARELLDLINATLDLSRLEAPRVPLQVRDVDVAEVAGEIDGELGALRARSTVDFRWHLSAPPPQLHTDPVKLKVVLKNLIHNAFKFTDAGSITVSAETRGERVTFEVADTGIGIAPDLHGVIFEPFRQADSSSTRSYGGVGLGLFIVQRLVELLGGGISVDSAVGEGARFRFWIPLSPEWPVPAGGGRVPV